MVEPGRKLAVVVVAPRGYQDLELKGALGALEEQGYGAVLASNEVGQCTGALGGTVQAELALRGVKVHEFDRVAFIGGPGSRVLFEDADAHRVAREFASAGKVVGAICLAPTILAVAGVLKGHRATVWTSADQKQARVLESHGATYTGEPVTVSGQFVTANGPSVSARWGEAFAKLQP